MKDADSIAALEEEYRSVFQLEDLTDDPRDESFDRFLDAFGDLGVAQYAHMKPKEIYDRLGIPSFYTPDSTPLTRAPSFPFLNKIISTIGQIGEDIPDFTKLNSYQDGIPLPESRSTELNEIRVRWHQLVGVSAIVDRCVEGHNVLLADSVGLGKTLICFMTMAYLRFCRYDQSAGGSPICKCNYITNVFFSNIYYSPS